MQPLGYQAFNDDIDPHYLFALGEANFEEEIRDMAGDLATIRNMPVATVGPDIELSIDRIAPLSYEGLFGTRLR